jgi:hypothetical protein
MESIEKSQWVVGLRLPKSVRLKLLSEIENRGLSQSRAISCILMSLMEDANLFQELLDKSQPVLRQPRKRAEKLLQFEIEEEMRGDQDSRWIKRLPKPPPATKSQLVDEWRTKCEEIRYTRVIHAYDHPGDFLIEEVLGLVKEWKHYLTRAQEEQWVRQSSIELARKRRQEIVSSWGDHRLPLCSQLAALENQLKTATERRERILQRKRTEAAAKLREFDQHIRLDERPALKLCFKFAARQLGYVEKEEHDPQALHEEVTSFLEERVAKRTSDKF